MGNTKLVWVNSTKQDCSKATRQETSKNVTRIQIREQEIADGSWIVAGFSLAHRKEVRTSVKYMVIYRHKDKYSISEMCRFFEVSRSVMIHSVLHFLQNRGKCFNSVSSISFTRVFFPQTGHFIHWYSSISLILLWRENMGVMYNNPHVK